MLNVGDVMTKKPATIGHNATLKQALELMERIGCRHLPVMSTDGHLIGILSDRDCRLALNSPLVMRERWQDEDTVHHTTIGSIMSPAPVVIEADATACEAARLMLHLLDKGKPSTVTVPVQFRANGALASQSVQR